MLFNKLGNISPNNWCVWYSRQKYGIIKLHYEDFLKKTTLSAFLFLLFSSLLALLFALFPSLLFAALLFSLLLFPSRVFFLHLGWWPFARNELNTFAQTLHLSKKCSTKIPLFQQKRIKLSPNPCWQKWVIRVERDFTLWRTLRIITATPCEAKPTTGLLSVFIANKRTISSRLWSVMGRYIVNNLLTNPPLISWLRFKAMADIYNRNKYNILIVHIDCRFA